MIAAETADPFRGGGFEGLAEYGSLDSARLSGRYALRAGDVGVMASAGWLRSDGIDSFGARRRARRLRQPMRRASGSRRGRPARSGSASPATMSRRPATMTASIPSPSCAPTRSMRPKNRIAAVRGWAEGRWGGWTVAADASYLDSANRNRLAGAPLNSTFGDRLTLGAQLSRRFGGHQLTARGRAQAEDFRARDTAFFGGTDQDRGRHLTAFVGEWRAEWSDWRRHRRRRPPRQLQRLRRRDHAARLAAGPPGPRPHPPRRLWRGHRPADLLRSVRLLPRLVRRQSGADARTCARLGGGDRLGAMRASASRRPGSRRGSGTRSSTSSIPSPSSPAPPMPTARAAATGSSSAAGFTAAPAG